MRRLLTIALLAVVLAGCSSAIHDDVNGYRASSGLPTLDYSVNLSGFAQQHASFMAATGWLVHSDLGSLFVMYPSLTACGETIGVFPRGTDASQIVAAWRASPPHDAILRGSWRMEGDATAVSDDGRLWASAEFCR